ncbi:MAG: DUF4143 domain-containing protein [bacterium]|nr:DUF4143 domain-containing protein [bacterium]
METSYQAKLLPSYHYNQRKQIIKTPKIYYLDTGLVNYFIRNHTVERMLNTGSWGEILEGHVFAEMYKGTKDMLPQPDIYYWRTSNGAEVDFVIQHEHRLIPVEVKASVHIKSSFIRGLKSFAESQDKIDVPFRIVIYRGEEVVYLNDSTLAVPLGLLF